MEKKKLMIVIISAILLIVICATIGISGVLSPYERQIRLGYKFLEQGNYEEAILAFDKAIEIDVKRDKAYIGKADVYVARCDENTLEDMKAVLEIAYNQHYNDKNIVDAIIRLSDDLMAREHGEWAIELLNFGYELTLDERINEHKIALLNKFAGLILADLYVMFENNEEENIKKEIQSEKYAEFMSLVTNADYKYIYFPEENETQTGTGIALYRIGTKRVCIYFGGYQNGKRNGRGEWVFPKDDGIYWFSGFWQEDFPNGEGVIRNIFDNHKVLKKSEIASNFIDGKKNGRTTYTQYEHDGDVRYLYGEFNNGNVIPINKSGREGYYEIAKGDGTIVDRIDHKFGVVGFLE